MLPGEEGIRALIDQLRRRPGPERDRRRRGLGPTIVALTEGIDVALANKESLVIGGELVTALAEATDARLIPVDSEHSALYQLIALRAGARDRDEARPDRLRRPLPRPHRPRGRHARATPSRTRPGTWAAGSRSTRRR